METRLGRVFFTEKERERERKGLSRFSSRNRSSFSRRVPRVPRRFRAKRKAPCGGRRRATPPRWRGVDGGGVGDGWRKSPGTNKRNGGPAKGKHNVQPPGRKQKSAAPKQKSRRTLFWPRGRGGRTGVNIVPVVPCPPTMQRPLPSLPEPHTLFQHCRYNAGNSLPALYGRLET